MGEGRIACLGAQRTQLRLGTGFVDLLQPDGPGPVADAVAARGAHLYSGGVSTHQFDALLQRLKDKCIEPVLEHDCIYLSDRQTGGFGMHLVISREENLPPVGDVDHLYEVSYLVEDSDAVTNHLADIFGLDSANFVSYVNSRFQYKGWLTLFEANKLSRFEIITPTGDGTTMQRFFSKFGQSTYMCYAETGKLPEIEARAASTGAEHTPQRPEGQKNADLIFLHPTTLKGTMLGLSRRTRAWHWSGQPDKVERVD
ncbi:hypothetical protein [Sulfitobacter geojensis]|uniref:hypothetical protein n=1 Tax=Sulfitobacter geojensis TaxID=1342299 RepID=UPI00046ACD6B|nr:hypothetical protein [Sulfitobacter geojensis]KHA54057.1 hypothetical protein Z947_86 [Sulfitobacter geojensis]NYI29875.1 hypothetical protein [Sulfitobacter geojensis]